MSEEDDNYSKTARIPTFDGTHAKFQMWWTRMKAYAALRGYAQTLKATKERDMPQGETTAIDLSTETGKKQAAAKKRNALAMANMTMAFTSEGLMALVYQSQDSEWPGGLVHKVVALLLKKYMPKDRISRVELRTAMAAVSMKKDDDPAVLFEQISVIQNKFNTAQSTIDEEELIAVVISVAPRE